MKDGGDKHIQDRRKGGNNGGGGDAVDQRKMQMRWRVRYEYDGSGYLVTIENGGGGRHGIETG